MPIANPGPLPWVSGLTIGRVLEQTVSAHPDRDALVFPALGLRWSWTEFGRRVERVARRSSRRELRGASTWESGR